MSDEQIERGDLELFVEVQRLLHVRLSSHETFFIRQLAGARPGYIEHACLSKELARIKSAQRRLLRNNVSKWRTFRRVHEGVYFISIIKNNFIFMMRILIGVMYLYLFYDRHDYDIFYIII